MFLQLSGVRIIGFCITVGVIFLIYWQLSDYHYSFIYGVFGVDTRPISDPRQQHDVPHLHNFFRLGGSIVRLRCVQSVSKVALAAFVLLYLCAT
jgi:hypothetical protein